MFIPTVKVLVKILKTLKEPIGKVELSEVTNIQYSRMANHIEWLEKREMVKSEIDGSYIKIILTEKGKDFLEIIK